jgi:hypothetical protein
MTLEDIEQQLPEGFHDASLDNLEFDMKNAILKLQFELLVEGLPKTILRLGECTIKNVSFFSASPYILFMPEKKSANPDRKWELTVFNLKKGIPEDFKMDMTLLNKSHSTSTLLLGDEKTWFNIIVSYETVDFKWIGEARTI